MSSVCVLMSKLCTFSMCHSSTKDVELRLNVGLTERKGLFAAPLSDWRVSLMSVSELIQKSLPSTCQTKTWTLTTVNWTKVWSYYWWVFFCFFFWGVKSILLDIPVHRSQQICQTFVLKPLYSKWCKWQQALFNSSLREGWFRNDKQSAHLRSTVYLRFVSMTTVEGFEATLKKKLLFFFFCHTSSASALSALPVLYLCWDRKVEYCPRALDLSILGLFHLIKCIYILHEDEEKWSQLWNCNPESVGLTWTLFCAHSTLEDTPQQPPPFLLSLLHLLPLSLSLSSSLSRHSPSAL